MAEIDDVISDNHAYHPRQYCLAWQSSRTEFLHPGSPEAALSMARLLHQLC